MLPENEQPHNIKNLNQTQTQKVNADKLWSRESALN